MKDRVSVWRVGDKWQISFPGDDHMTDFIFPRLVLRDVNYEHRGVITGVVVFIGDNKNAFPPEVTKKAVVNPGVIKSSDFALLDSKRGENNGIVVAGWTR